MDSNCLDVQNPPSEGMIIQQRFLFNRSPQTRPSRRQSARQYCRCSDQTPQLEDGLQHSSKTEVRHTWTQLIRWSKAKQQQNGANELDRVSKVAVFGGGSFGTAMGVALARKKSSLKVQLLLRDPKLVTDINERHLNTKYLQVSNPVFPAISRFPSTGF